MVAFLGFDEESLEDSYATCYHTKYAIRDQQRYGELLDTQQGNLCKRGKNKEWHAI